MIIDGQVVPDSAEIIKSLRAKYETIGTSRDTSKLFTDDSEEWSKWSADKLAVLLYPNITRSFNESWECFGYVNDVKSWHTINRVSNRVLGPIAMSFANGRIKAKYNIWDERKDLKELLSTWTTALNGNKFLHSENGVAFISLPDLMVYGVLRSIQGMETFKVIMDENATLKTWYDNVHVEVEGRSNKH